MLRLDPISAVINTPFDKWKVWFSKLYTFLKRLQHIQLDITPTSVGANTSDEQTFAAPGLNTKDVIYINKPDHQAGLGIVNARVSAAGTVAITFMNTTSGSITPTAGLYQVIAVRRD